MSKTSEKAEERPVLLALLICAIAYSKQTPCSLETADSRRSEGGGVKNVFPNRQSSRSVHLHARMLPHGTEPVFTALFLHSKP